MRSRLAPTLLSLAIACTALEAAAQLDTDGDGYLDDWETNGYDADGDGVVDVPLHILGFDPLRKDIAVGYVWMDQGVGEVLSHQPSQAVLDAVVESFARAPVTNPDGSTGVTLHLKDFGSVAHDTDLNPVWTEFDAIMDPRFTQAERTIYRRMLNAHGYSGGTSSGIARGIPASDYIESLGRWSTNPGTFEQRAGTIMHELGHTLGLRHGGPDNTNYKPNHLSVMSYFNQVVWLIKDGQPYLDYERFNLNALNETSLDELEGLDVLGFDFPLRGYGVRYFSSGTAVTKGRAAHRRVDWDNDGNRTEASVSVDLNSDGVRNSLRANFPEWENLIYDGGSIGAGSEAKSRRVVELLVEPELTEEMDWEIRRNTVEVW